MVLGILDYKYLSEEHIKGFDHYKYSSVDTSPIAVYVSHPFWNQVVKLYPKWLAPNVLTFSGMILVMSAFVLVSFFDYDMFGSSDEFPNFPPIPTWIWLVCGIFTFTAHVLDGTDGKQARRTGSSGPTGELFDHGIDSWLTIPFTVTLYSIFGRADYSVSALRQLVILMSVQIVFVISHWEKYNTGILFLSWGYDLSQYALATFYFVTYFGGGYQLWKFYISTALGITPAHLIECAFLVGCFAMSLPMSLYNIHKSYKNKTLKQESIYEGMLPMFSTCYLFVVGLVWVLSSPLNIVDIDPRMCFWMIGTIFSNISCRLIVSQMTQTRCEPFNWLLWPYTLLAGVCVCGGLGRWELYLLRSFTLFVTLAHIHYGVCVVRQMCSHFGIRCFSLQKPEKSAANGVGTHSD